MDLAGAAVGVVGRFDRVPRTRLADEMARRGARMTRSVAGASGIVIGHGAHVQVEAGTLPGLIDGARERGCWCLSERAFLRRLDLLPPRRAAHRTIPAAELAQQAGLAERTVHLLALFDVLDDEEGRFEFRDLVIARGLRRLIDAGASLGRVIAAAVQVQAQANGSPVLAHGRLVQLPEGDLAFRIGRHLADGDGQLHLPLDRAGNPTPAELFARGEAAEDEGRWSDAEIAYRRLADIAPRDAVARFNLANVLRAQERPVEAKRMLQQATAIAPDFAEAWYNLAHLAEDEADDEAARRCLEQAIAIDAGYADAIYNLARLLLRGGAPAAAADLYERYLAIDRSSRWAQRARRSLILCRLMAHAQPATAAPALDALDALTPSRA